jgi:hypothetical protein
MCQLGPSSGGSLPSGRCSPGPCAALPVRSACADTALSRTCGWEARGPPSPARWTRQARWSRSSCGHSAPWSVPAPSSARRSPGAGAPRRRASPPSTAPPRAPAGRRSPRRRMAPAGCTGRSARRPRRWRAPMCRSTIGSARGADSRGSPAGNGSSRGRSGAGRLARRRVPVGCGGSTGGTTAARGTGTAGSGHLQRASEHAAGRSVSGRHPPKAAGPSHAAACQHTPTSRSRQTLSICMNFDGSNEVANTA